LAHKQDGLAGKALGIQANYKKNDNMYQQNAQYSEMSQQQTTNEKINTQGGINKAVDFDVRDSRIKASGQMGNIEGIEKAVKDVFKNAEAGTKEFVEALKNASKEISENQQKGQFGNAKGIAYEKSIHGGVKSNIAMDLAQSGVESQMEGSFGAISAFGKGQKAIHALARQSKTVSQGDTRGKSAEIGSSSIFGGYAAMKEKQARMSVGQSFTSYAGKLAGGAINENGSYTAEGIEAYTSQEAMSTGAAMVFGGNMNDKDKAKELNDALRPKIKMEKSGLENKDGSPVLGAKRAAALGRAQGGDLFGIKGGTFEGINGEQVSLGITQGNDGKVRVSKISSGTNVDTGGENAAMVAEFEAVNGEGSSETMAKEFAKFKKNYQKGNAIKQGWFGGVEASIAEATGADAETVENGMMIATGAAVIGIAGLTGKLAKKAASKSPFLNKKVREEESSKGSNNQSTNSTDEKVENKHNNSLNDIDDINTKIDTNQANFQETGKKVKDLEKTYSGLSESMAKKRKQINAMEKEGASYKDISKAEDELSSMADKQRGVGSNLSDAREKLSGLADEFDNLNGSKIEAEKAFLNAETPKVKPTMLENAVSNAGKIANYTSANKVAIAKGGGAVGLAFGIGHVMETQGFQAVVDYIKDEAVQSVSQFKQESSQIGGFSAGMNQVMDALSGEKNRVAARQQEANGNTLGGIATLTGGFLDNTLNSVSFLAQASTAAIQTGDQNLGIGVNKTYEQNFNALDGQFLKSDIGGYLSSGGFDKMQQSFMNALPSFNFGNSSISHAAASALQQPELMSQSLMPQMVQPQVSDPGKGGIFDSTTTLSGMMNMANTQTQQLATQQIQGEVYNVNGQVDIVKNMMEKMIKTAPNVTNEDVAKLKKQVGHMRANSNS